MVAQVAPFLDKRRFESDLLAERHEAERLNERGDFEIRRKSDRDVLSRVGEINIQGDP